MDDVVFALIAVGLAIVLHSAWPIAIFGGLYVIAWIAS